MKGLGVRRVKKKGCGKGGLKGSFWKERVWKESKVVKVRSVGKGEFLKEGWLK